MGKLSISNNFSSVKSWEDLRRFASAWAADVTNQLTGKLTFGDNMQGVFIDVSFPNAAVSVPFTHNLGYVPNGFFVTQLDSAAVIYDGPESNTATIIFLKCTQANASAKVRVF